MIRKTNFPLSLIISLIIIYNTSFSQPAIKNDEIDNLAIKVSAKENREFSFTDKKMSYYYARTHQNFNDFWFAGWNINTKRVLKDYELYIDGSKLNRSKSSVTVYPYKLERKFKECKEELFLVDTLQILFISMENIHGKNISIKILGDLDSIDQKIDNGVLFIPKEAPNNRILIAPYQNTLFDLKSSIISTNKNACGFLIIYGKDKDDVLKLLDDFRKNGEKCLDQRKQRMNKLITNNVPLKSNDEQLSKSLKWLILTTDQLIMNQMGWGIYAGLPWFNDYWGRDMFITLPGACLVTGLFEKAKKILLSFAKFQNNDKNSKYFGRIPNRARPDDIIYNTTDGTPRFIVEILDYIHYSGDTSIIRLLYPIVAKAIEGSLKYWIDEKGYLTHDDADTWMDAKEKGIRPFSPRGNRANDIQSLWYQQLKASTFFAQYMQDSENASKWTTLAQKVKESFNNDFVDKNNSLIADRISSNGEKDYKIRPNQLYTFDLIDNDDLKMEVTKNSWQSIVYPWGVASLSQMDQDFFPYHENWHYYHKDAAYHNGTIWLWNNGIAMQRMIEFGQPDIAYKLFKNMNYQAIYEGAVGSLSENADALPRDGNKRGKISGTFLQAWSNAEHLRVWYQYFLGINPRMEDNEIFINPQIPEEISYLNYSVIIGNGKMDCIYKKTNNKFYSYRIENISPTLNISFFGYDNLQIFVKSGFSIEIIEKKSNIIVNLLDEKGKIIKSYRLVSNNNISIKKKRDLFFKDTQFCKPFLQEDLKSLSNYHEKALEY